MPASTIKIKIQSRSDVDSFLANDFLDLGGRNNQTNYRTPYGINSYHQPYGYGPTATWFAGSYTTFQVFIFGGATSVPVVSGDSPGIYGGGEVFICRTSGDETLGPMIDSYDYPYYEGGNAGYADPLQQVLGGIRWVGPEWWNRSFFVRDNNNTGFNANMYTRVTVDCAQPATGTCYAPGSGACITFPGSGGITVPCNSGSIPGPGGPVSPVNDINLTPNPVTPGSTNPGTGTIDVYSVPYTVTVVAFGGASPGGSSQGTMTISGVGSVTTTVASIYQTKSAQLVINTPGTYNITVSGTFVGTSGNTVSVIG